jgi:hypothetical protein
MGEERDGATPVEPRRRPEPGSSVPSVSIPPVLIPPVLIVVFNRPEVVVELLASLRTVRPTHVYVAADGPRSDHPSDTDRCRRVRDLVATIDWPCEVHERFSDHNLGLQRSMVSAIDWFFEHVEAGVILEDDCLVRPEFFEFAAEMLERYRGCSQVIYVTALNMAPHERNAVTSYHFASAGHIWGWATWRRAWEGYDSALREWPAMRADFGRGSPPLRRALGRKFDSAHSGDKHTWARAWHFHVMRRAGVVVVPAVNLVSNIGFGDDATHTTSRRHRLAHLRAGSLAFPLDHPAHMVPDTRYDAALAGFHTWSWRRRLRERLDRVIRLRRTGRHSASQDVRAERVA